MADHALARPFFCRRLGMESVAGNLLSTPFVTILRRRHQLVEWNVARSACFLPLIRRRTGKACCPCLYQIRIRACTTPRWLGK